MKSVFFFGMIAVWLTACATRPSGPQQTGNESDAYYQASTPEPPPSRRLLPDPTSGLGQTNDPSIRVTDIRQTDRHTVLYLTFGLADRTSVSSEISIQPEVHLISRGAGKKYALVRAEGLPVSPGRRTVTAGEQVEFRLYFNRLDDDVTDFAMYECQDSQTTTCWNIVGMKVPGRDSTAAGVR